MTPAADFAPIAVLGAGSWGTALAMQLARGGQPVTLWGRNAADLQDLASHRVNRRYLPGIELPASVQPDADLQRVVGSHRELLVCVPSHAFRATLAAIAPGPRSPAPAWPGPPRASSTAPAGCPTKWRRRSSGAGVPVAVLSGPTFAREVAAGLPTAMTVAASDPAYAAALAARLSDHTFRAYTSDDMIGVEVGGAVKNVLAIGAGISDGLGFGANTRIALITRGLVEMTRLGRRARGPGDDVHGPVRHGRPGAHLHRRPVAQPALRPRDRPGPDAGRGGPRASARWSRASSPPAPSGRWPRRLKLEMPICEQVYRVLEENVSPQDAVMALMARALKPE